MSAIDSSIAPITFLAVLLAACNGQGGAPGVSITDSAGVRVVEVSSVRNLDVPEWQTRLIYSTVSGPSPVELFEFGDAVLLADSSLLIGDRRSPELIFLDSRGIVSSRMGRLGEGPGEYTNIDRVGVGIDGTVFVFDGRQQRTTLLDTAGTVLAVQRVDLDGRFLPYMPLGRFARGGFSAVLEMRPLLPPGLQRDALLLIVTDSLSQVVDTVGQWPGKERHVTEDGNRWLQVGYARTALYAGRGQYALVGTTDSLDLTLFEESTPVLRLRGPPVPIPVTAAERDAWATAFLAQYPEPRRPAERRLMEQSTINGTYPAFGALAVSRSGTIWIGEYAKLGQRRRQWTVFARDGTPVGRLDLPIYVPRHIETEIAITYSPSHELVDVTANHVAILRKDAFDVQYVEVLEILRS
jgi:hypothetical protein